MATQQHNHIHFHVSRVPEQERVRTQEDGGGLGPGLTQLVECGSWCLQEAMEWAQDRIWTLTFQSILCDHGIVNNHSELSQYTHNELINTDPQVKY